MEGCEKYTRYFDIKYFYAWIAHSLITIIGDTYIFNPAIVFNDLKYYLMKVISCGALLIFWQAVGWWAKQIKSNSSFHLAYLRHFSFYFTVMFVFLIIVWPGVWRSDDIVILEYARNLQLEYWQHFLTTVFDIFALMILPFPGGVVITQLFIISLIVAYILTRTEMLLLDNKKISYFLYIPFLSPVIIDANLFPLRLSLYSFILLFTLFQMILIYLSRREIRWGDVIFFSCLISILSVWRSEAIFYTVLGPLVLYLLSRNKIGIRKIMVLLILSILITSLLNIVQTRGIKAQTGNPFKYKLTAISEPLAALLKHPLRGKNVEEHISMINKVVDVNLLKNHSGMEALFYLDGIREEFTKADYSNMMDSFIYLAIHNPKPILDNRLKYFAEASGFLKTPNSMILNSSELFSLIPPYNQPIYKNFVEYPANKPINAGLRERVIKILELRSIDNYYKPTPLYYLIYNVAPCLLLGMGFLIYYVFRKKWGMATLFLLVLGSVPLIIFAAPAPYFMYYQPLYLWVYFFSTLFVIAKLTKEETLLKRIL